MKKLTKKIIITLLSIAAITVFVAIILNNQKNTVKNLKEQKENFDITKNNDDLESKNPEQDRSIQHYESSNQDIVKQANDKSLITTSNKKPRFLHIKDSDFVYGDKNAKILFIEYGSLSCPHCASFHREAFEKIKKEYVDSGKVAFIHRDFILNQQSLVAATFAICQANKSKSDRVEKYYDIIKVLFKTQDSWAFDKKFIEKLQSIAMLDGVSNQEFNECIEDKKIQQKILNEFIELKNAIHLESAPTFFINQQQLVGYSDYLTIKQVIEKELDSAK